MIREPTCLDIRDEKGKVMVELVKDSLGSLKKILGREEEHCRAQAKPPRSSKRRRRFSRKIVYERTVIQRMFPFEIIRGIVVRGLGAG